MSKRKYLDAETLKQHLFMEAALGYIKTLADVNRVIDTLPEAEPCLNWHPASETPPLHHEVDEDKCEGTLECDVSEPLLLYTEEEGYKVGVYMKDCYGFDGWLNPDYGGIIRHVVEWQYPQKPSKERSKGGRRRLLRPRSDRPRRCPLCGRYVLTVRQREPGGGLSLDAASETTVGG